MADSSPISRRPASGILSVKLGKGGIAELVEKIRQTGRTLVVECDGPEVGYVTVSITSKTDKGPDVEITGHVTIGGNAYSVELRTHTPYKRANLRFL